tara:strand:+ start:29832 stop:30080 length:249 start_codon:yes stop_codon:yes gene_type:complete
MMSWELKQASAYGGILMLRIGQGLLWEQADNHFEGYVRTFGTTYRDRGGRASLSVRGLAHYFNEMTLAETQPAWAPEDGVDY